MSIADKLVYLDGTKTALADAINVALSARGEAPLDANATFRSYAERLFYPGYLFGQGEQGTYSLPPNPDGYFTDTAGTTPAALTDAVALVRGEVGPDWTQGTATARPLWAREPEGGRRNLLGFTEDVSQWGNMAGEVTLLGGVGDPVGGTSAIRITGNSSLRRATIPVQVPYGQVGLAYTTRVWARSPNGGTFALYFANATSVTVTPTTEWVAYDVTLTRVGTDNPSVFQLRVGQDGGIIEVWHPQSEVGTASTAYQRVTTAADVTEDGVPEVPYVRFDLADDVLTTTLPAGAYTVVLPTRQGIWIDSVEHAGGTFSIGHTSYTGGPAGILTALESDGVAKLIAPPLVIDRALTDAERNGLVRWYQARGAGELLEVLP